MQQAEPGAPGPFRVLNEHPHLPTELALNALGPLVNQLCLDVLVSPSQDS